MKFTIDHHQQPPVITDIDASGMSILSAQLIEHAFIAALKAHGESPLDYTLAIQTHTQSIVPLSRLIDAQKDAPRYLADLLPDFMRLHVTLSEGVHFQITDHLAGCRIGDLYALHRLLIVLNEIVHDELVDEDPSILLYVGKKKYLLADLYANIADPSAHFDKSLASFPALVERLLSK